MTLLSALLLLAACGGGDSGAEPGTGTSIATTGSTDPTDTPELTETTEVDSGTVETTEATAPQDQATGDGAVTVTIGDSSWDITEIIECEVGDDVSDDFRQFTGTTADGGTSFSMSYFPDESLAGLNGVSLETDVDGNDWTYASSYAGSDGVFDLTLTDSGSEGFADVGVVGIGAPGDLSTLVWSISC